MVVEGEVSGLRRCGVGGAGSGRGGGIVGCGGFG